jgi:hypothetical protein
MRSPASGTWITSLGGGSNVHLSRERRDGSPFGFTRLARPADLDPQP